MKQLKNYEVSKNHPSPSPEGEGAIDWFVYILRCADNSLYIGITTDIERRLIEHNRLKIGAKYTRGRRPVTLVYSEQKDNHSLALKREHELKQLPKTQKETMINDAL